MDANNAENVAQKDAFAGGGDLGNIMGNPVETGLFLTHLIFDGTLDRFPGLKICGAHAGGYLASYSGRSDALCGRAPGSICTSLQKNPSGHFRKTLFWDTKAFLGEALRHRDV